MKDLRRRLAVLAALIAWLLVPAGPAAGADPAADLAAAGWEESTPGRWNRLADRKVQLPDNGIAGEFVVAPGTGAAWAKKGSWELSAGAILSFELSSDGTNPSSKDYSESGRRFPVSVTVVFGKDSEALPFKTRLADFFARIWRGFPPGGIRLTYAIGNRAPVGSMYRPGDDEETVFILAGEDEKGKRVAARRDLLSDFRAAYGRDPKGPVTRIVVQTVRPSDESGPIRTAVRLTLPAR